jgi:hypothetical protein
MSFAFAFWFVVLVDFNSAPPVVRQSVTYAERMKTIIEKQPGTTTWHKPKISAFQDL